MKLKVAIDMACLIPPTYLTTYALAQGVNSSLSYQLLAILNASQIIGRILPGYIADRLGRFNVMVLSSAPCAILVLALWLTAGSDEGAVIGFAATFGLFSGTAYSLTPVCISQLCRTEEYARKYGTAYLFISIATLTGIPISGAILNADGGNFKGVILFCGSGYLASGVLLGGPQGGGGGGGIARVY